jgi:hypothetical protein
MFLKPQSTDVYLPGKLKTKNKMAFEKLLINAKREP